MKSCLVTMKLAKVEELVEICPARLEVPVKCCLVEGKLVRDRMLLGLFPVTLLALVKHCPVVPENLVKVWILARVCLLIMEILVKSCLDIAEKLVTEGILV